jgi:hypothetical protein
MADIVREKLQERLRIADSRLADINAVLLDPDTTAINAFLDVVARYGTPDEINRQAQEARRLPKLMQRLAEMQSPYLDDVEWLIEQSETGAFISLADYRRRVLGDRADEVTFDEHLAVTLEISALQYFPFLIAEAQQAIDRQDLMPIIGASYVETLDTKGTDGSNIHLGGPETITGYFGGVGQPNDHALKWLDEYLHYYTTYGIKQVLNINPGTVLLGYFLHKLGVDNEFKISVFMGNDNPYAALWTLIGAKLFARDDGSTPLIGFNWSNSANNETLEITAQIRRGLGFEDLVRFEHHITETWKSIVRQPYIRRAELVEVAGRVPNISAKHEGGDPAVEKTREHPSDILDYFRDKAEIEAAGDMPALARNYLDKHQALNRTAQALTEHGLSVVPARKLHRVPVAAT